MNPCPCGQWGNPQADCLCTPDRISRYLAKLSAPLLDRIDMQIHLQALPQEELIKPNQTADGQSEIIRRRVEKIRALQNERQACLNSQLSAKDCETVCVLGKGEQAFLLQAMNQLKLSARAYHRLLKVARTIADMDGQEKVALRALQQALSFKQTLQMPK